MTRASRFTGALVLALSLTASTSPAIAGDAEFIRDFLIDFERTSGRIVELAEAVPADKYGWAPSEEVRNVGEVYMHVVGTNLLIPAGLGATPSEGLEMAEGGPIATLEALEAKYTDKAQILEQLHASIEYAKQAVGELGVLDLEEEMNLFGFPGSRRQYMLILLTHSHEHLGQSIAYARSLGVTPPWSQAQEGDG